MKKTLHRGGFDTLNVYTNLAGGFLGYAYLPGLPDSHLWQDGIVLNWESMPDASPTFEGRFDLGFTLVHEAGHWFNLEHTFFGACNAKGDFVDDTPPMREPTSRLPRGQGHLPRAGARSDPQLHGLLGRPLLQPVHDGSGRPDAGRLDLRPGFVGDRSNAAAAKRLFRDLRDRASASADARSCEGESLWPTEQHQLNEEKPYCSSATEPDRRWISGCATGVARSETRHHRDQRHERVGRRRRAAGVGPRRFLAGLGAPELSQSRARSLGRQSGLLRLHRRPGTARLRPDAASAGRYSRSLPAVRGSRNRRMRSTVTISISVTTHPRSPSAAGG